MTINQFEFYGCTLSVEHEEDEHNGELFIFNNNETSISDKIKALMAFHELFASKSSYKNVWLLIQNHALQPNNRITMHNKLWKSLKPRGFDFSSLEKTEEYITEDKNGLRFRGGVKIPTPYFDKALKLMKEDKSSYLIYVDEKTDIKKHIKYGWDGSCKTDINFINKLIKDGGIIIKPVGEFDDTEHGIKIFSTYTAATKIIKSLKIKKISS